MSNPIIFIRGQHGPIRVELRQPSGEWVDITHLVEKIEIRQEHMIFDEHAWGISPIAPDVTITATGDLNTPPEWGP